MNANLGATYSATSVKRSNSAGLFEDGLERRQEAQGVVHTLIPHEYPLIPEQRKDEAYSL